jgi:hypothetical protein
MKTRKEGSLVPRLTNISRMDILVVAGVEVIANSALKADTTDSNRWPGNRSACTYRQTQEEKHAIRTHEGRRTEFIHAHTYIFTIYVYTYNRKMQKHQAFIQGSKGNTMQ